MKKKIICALCCALMVTGLVGCNNNDSESSQQTQQNETTVAQQVETTTSQENIEEETIANSSTDNTEETSGKEDKTKESNDEEAATLYKEVVDNMNNAKNYHTEQKIDMDISTVSPDGNMNIQTTMNIAADYSRGKTDDGKPCTMIHSKSKVSIIGMSSEYEAYAAQDPGNSDNYYAYYEKQSASTGNTKSQWEDKTKDTKSITYSQFFPDSIKNIKINKAESTSEIVVLEGDASNLLSNSYLQNTGENTDVDTKIKIKIDAVNKVILEAEIAATAKTESSTGAKNTATAKGIQKFSKINKNVTVKIPDAVKKEAKQSKSSNTGSVSKLIDFGN